jgi:diadenosine tetraphosphate (Ap4A) HIT family hydrolase
VAAYAPFPVKTDQSNNVGDYSSVIDTNPAYTDNKCGLCYPREPNNEYRREIVRLQFSTLYLFADQRFRGYCLLFFDVRHAVALDELTQDEYSGYLFDLRLCTKAIRAALTPDHMNLELLGNTSPHLHWHIIPRYKTDPRWGQPIWEGWQRNEFNVNRVTLNEREMHQIIAAIQNQIFLLSSIKG